MEMSRTSVVLDIVTLCEMLQKNGKFLATFQSNLRAANFVCFVVVFVGKYKLLLYLF